MDRLDQHGGGGSEILQPTPTPIDPRKARQNRCKAYQNLHMQATVSNSSISNPVQVILPSGVVRMTDPAFDWNTHISQYRERPLQRDAISDAVDDQHSRRGLSAQNRRDRFMN